MVESSSPWPDGGILGGCPSLMGDSHGTSWVGIAVWPGLFHLLGEFLTSMSCDHKGASSLDPISCHCWPFPQLSKWVGDYWNSIAGCCRVSSCASVLLSLF